LAILVVLGWFFLGTQWNIRKGERALRWLEGGLDLMGKKTTLRWLGSSVVELKIEQAREPFRRAEILIVLEPRDVPLFWWFFRLRGREDLLIVRTQLRSAPSVELEAMDRRAWSARGLERRLREGNWQRASATLSSSSLVTYSRGEAEAVCELVQLAAVPHCCLVRLAVHRTVPNLEAHWTLPDLDKVAARSVFEALRLITDRI